MVILHPELVHILKVEFRKLVMGYHLGAMIPGDEVHSELVHYLRAGLQTMAERYYSVVMPGDQLHSELAHIGKAELRKLLMRY